MSDFDSLAICSEHYCVVADNIPGPGCGETYGLAITGACLPLAAINCHLIKITAQGIGDNLAHAQRRTRRCIYLVPVMCLQYFNIDIVAEDAGGDIQQLETQIHPGAEVGGLANRDHRGRGVDFSLLLDGKTRGTDHHEIGRAHV